MNNKETEIIIPNIEKELNAFSNKNEANPQNNPSKACLFTLIVYAKEKERVSYLQGLIDNVLDKFPFRIIFIQSEVSNSSFCHVKVSNVLSGKSSTSGSATNKCDQIVINVSEDQLFRVSFIVEPHIVTDLPVYLLWGQNPFIEKDIFFKLQDLATRVIFDAEFSSIISTFYNKEHSLVYKPKVEFMDISWALISNWRDMMVQLFDTPDKIRQLYEIESLSIYYNAPPKQTGESAETRALYFQAWLASCLRWQYKEKKVENNKIGIVYEGNTPVKVTLIANTYPEIPNGSLYSIKIKTTQGDSYEITRKEKISQVMIHASTKETCEIPFTLPLPNVHKGMMFMRELFFNTLGSSYYSMLNVLSHTLEKKNE